MADLSEAQKQSYWRYNIRLTTILLVIWFVVTYLISGLWAGAQLAGLSGAAPGYGRLLSRPG